ncbi:MAG: DoxX family protein [Hyphomicrobiaceae bacterium]
METAPSIVQKLAEVLICLPFLASAVSKALDFDGARNELAALGLPQPHVLAVAVIGLQFVAPAMILLGIGAWIGTLALAGFTTLATLLAHRWWTMPQGKQAHHLQVFMEHAAIVGGLLLIALVDIVGWRGWSRS